jgi:hypothetical protein
MEAHMGLRLTLIATAAAILPSGAFAQAAAQDQQSAQQPTASTAPAAPKADTAAKADAAASAKAEVKAGATVYDSKGNAVGKIDSVDGKSATLYTGKVSVKIPVASIARDEKGLAIGMTKAEIEAAANKKN